MGSFFAIILGLPFITVLWVGAAWVVIKILSETKITRALADLAEKDPEKWARAMQVRKGY